MNLEEKTVASHSIYEGKILHLCEDEIELPDGRPAKREYIKHIGAVCVLPLTDDGQIVLERQYRYPFHEVLVEIPAGKLDRSDEDPRKAALRELREETGLHAAELIPLGDYYGSPAILDERIRMFVARGLTQGEQRLDEDEFLHVFRMPLADAVEEVLAGRIPDGKTQVAILRTAAMLAREKQR